MESLVAQLKSTYSGRKVLVTGNTGFKGAWLTLFLERLGAEVYGISLAPIDGSIYSDSPILDTAHDFRLDVRCREAIREAIRSIKPDLVFHLAGQTLVLESIENPSTSFGVNVLGTVHVLESLNAIKEVKGCLVTTTDKVYSPKPSGEPFIETDELGGAHDPYSASKAATEFAIRSMRKLVEFKNDSSLQIVSARAGNVIGGGDNSRNRLIPDLVRSATTGISVSIRSPASIRPWQHVLDPIFGYLKCGYYMLNDVTLSLEFNFGPSPEAFLTVEQLSRKFIDSWVEHDQFKGDVVFMAQNSSPIETSRLLLNSSKAKKELGWSNTLDPDRSIEWIIEWTVKNKNLNARERTLNQIDKYLEILGQLS
jgi:CDP-glucose 4,6-dehydratase